jgi:hypothetical protein
MPIQSSMSILIILELSTPSLSDLPFPAFMPPSARKDYVSFIVIHKVPPNLSKKEFEGKLEA